MNGSTSARVIAVAMAAFLSAATMGRKQDPRGDDSPRRNLFNKPLLSTILTMPLWGTLG